MTPVMVAEGFLADGTPSAHPCRHSTMLARADREWPDARGARCFAFTHPHTHNVVEFWCYWPDGSCPPSPGAAPPQLEELAAVQAVQAMASPYAAVAPASRAHSSS